MSFVLLLTSFFFTFGFSQSGSSVFSSLPDGVIIWEGHEINVGFFCDTDFLGELTAVQYDRCTKIAIWFTILPIITEDEFNALYTQDFNATHYLPETIPFGGKFCCSFDVYTDRIPMVLDNTLVLKDFSVGDLRMVAISESAVHVTWAMIATVIDTDKSFEADTAETFYFDENGQIYTLQIWTDPFPVIDAFTP